MVQANDEGKVSVTTHPSIEVGDDSIALSMAAARQRGVECGVRTVVLVVLVNVSWVVRSWGTMNWLIWLVYRVIDFSSLATLLISR